MAMHVPSVVQCTACSRPFWRELATEVGEFDPWNRSDLDDEGLPIDPAFRAAPRPH